MNEILFEVRYAYEADGAEMWATRVYVLAMNIGDAWTEARKMFAQDMRITSLRELPKGKVVSA